MVPIGFLSDPELRHCRVVLWSNRPITATINLEYASPAEGERPTPGLHPKPTPHHRLHWPEGSPEIPRANERSKSPTSPFASKARATHQLRQPRQTPDNPARSCRFLIYKDLRAKGFRPDYSIRQRPPLSSNRWRTNVSARRLYAGAARCPRDGSDLGAGVTVALLEQAPPGPIQYPVTSWFGAWLATRRR